MQSDPQDIYCYINSDFIVFKKTVMHVISVYMYTCCCWVISVVSNSVYGLPIDGSPPGSPVPGILQARTLECVAIPFSNAWKWKVKGKWLSHVWFFSTPWTAAYQPPLSMGFSRQEYWSGVPSPSPCIHVITPNIRILDIRHTVFQNVSYRHNTSFPGWGFWTF